MMIKALMALMLATEPQAASESLDDAAALYRTGGVLYESADYQGAIVKFTKALTIVVSLGGEDHTRLTLLYNIGLAHQKQFEIDRDVTHLRTALNLYRRYRKFARETGSLMDEMDVEPRILRLEKQLRTNDQIQRNREKNREENKPLPAPPPAGDSASPVDDGGWKKSRNTGIGLVVGGAGATIGGIVLAAVGSGFESNAKAQVDELADLGVPLDHPAWAQGAQYIEQERDKGRALIGGGVALAVVGAGVVGVGAYFLVKSKKLREGAVAVTPAMWPGMAGVQITGRF